MIVNVVQVERSYGDTCEALLLPIRLANAGRNKLGEIYRFIIHRSLQARKQFLGTIGTYSVSERCIRMMDNVCFELVPVSLVVANLFAMRAYREHTA